MNHSGAPATGGDIDALIAAAEHAVIATDARFRRHADELGAALRGHAGRVIAGSTAGVAVALLGWLLYRTRAARRDAGALGRGAPARPMPPQRAGAAATLGDVLARAARPGGVLPLLLTSVVPWLVRAWQRRTSQGRHDPVTRDR